MADGTLPILLDNLPVQKFSHFSRPGPSKSQRDDVTEKVTSSWAPVASQASHPAVLIVAVATGFVAVTLLGTQFLIRALREHRESEARFQQVASNIQEIFWMIGAETKKALYVNDAYQTITGRSCQSLTDNPTSYKDVIHPEDRDHVLAKLEEAIRTGQFNKDSVSSVPMVTCIGSRCTGFPCGTPQARFGGWTRAPGCWFQKAAPTFWRWVRDCFLSPRKHLQDTGRDIP
jgi:hypothetical protein